MNTAHNDGLLAEVDIADGEALVDEFERPAGRRLALLLLAHMIISSPCAETSYLVRTLTTLIIEHPRVPQAEVLGCNEESRSIQLQHLAPALLRGNL